MKWRSLAILVLLSALSASGANAAAAARRKSVLIKDVPHVRQRTDFCGEACAEMFLRKLGSKINQNEVFNRSGLTPVRGRGCYTAELKRSLERIGFKTGPTWRSINAAKSAQELEAQWRALHADLLRGIPSIVCTRYSDQPKTTEHFRLVLGYDARKDEVIYHEPAEDKAGYRRMKRKLFLKLWPLKYNSRRWTVIRLRLEAGRIAPSLGSKGLTDADYAQHVMALKARLKQRLPGRIFHIVIQKPFVVVGDEAANKVKLRATRTVKWAADKFKQAYFSKDPATIHDVWLFKGKASYQSGAVALFGSKPSTPFGYYSSSDRALVMNIATGGGTLVHEMLHAFMAPNFPACPSWFNEGMGSLYEQCGSKDGKIWGYTNWRLPGLQKAIRRKKVPSFKTLCSTTTHQFYNMDRGTNYSQARYLCYYLQKHGLLRKYYKAFFKAQKTDPSGYGTLKKILGKKTEKDMLKFKKDWEAWVLKLRFR
jgi:Peptidase_C39 like family